MTGTKMLNPMYSIATDQTIAYAEQIKDESRNKFQKDINDEVQTSLAQKPSTEHVEEMIAEAIQPAQNDIVNVATYSTTPPQEPEDGMMYIDSDDNKLYSYVVDNDEWVEETPSTDALYIADDTSNTYRWNGTAFVSTQTNIIVVDNIDEDLKQYTEKGMYTVYERGVNDGKIYNMIVSVIVRRPRGGRQVTTVTQTLTTQEGWWQRKCVNSTWDAEWEEHIYIYQEQYQTLYDLACAGLVL